jgi:heme/copper-type cytochrome/quinol oxidase subunit 2
LPLFTENLPWWDSIPTAMKAEEQSPNDPNRGLNTKAYMIALLTAIIVIFIAAYFFVAARGSKDIPKADKPHPNASVQVIRNADVS